VGDVDIEPKRPGFDDYLFRFLEQLNTPHTQSSPAAGSVSGEDRAIQLAAKLAREYHFQDGVEVLVAALNISRHGRTIAALKELLQLGTTKDELMLVLQLRASWREYPEFSAFVGDALSFGGSRREILSYRLALRLIKHFPYQVELEEVIYFLHDLLLLWRDRQDLMGRFSAFQDFVGHVVTSSGKPFGDEMDMLEAWREEL
jgi:hypothetical protein